MADKESADQVKARRARERERERVKREARKEAVGKALSGPLASPLEDTVWVRRHEKHLDVTPGQKAARKLLERSVSEFNKEVDRLEAKARSEPADTTPPSPGSEQPAPLKDAGAQRVGLLCEKHLAEFRRRRGLPPL